MSEEKLEVTEVAPETKKEKKKKEKSKVQKIIEWVLFGIFIVVFGFAAIGFVDGLIHKKQNHNKTLMFGIGTFFVETNSMEPLYKVKDALLSYKTSCESIEKAARKIKTAEIIDNADEIVIGLQESESIDIVFYNGNSGINPVTIDFYHDDLYNPAKNYDAECIITNRYMTHRITEIHISKTLKYGQGKYAFITSGINHNGDYSLMGQYQIVTENEFLGKIMFKSTFLGAIFSFMTTVWGLLLLLLIPAMYLIVTSGIDIFKALKESEEKQPTVSVSSEQKIEGISEEDKKRLKQELLDEMIAKKLEEKGGKIDDKKE